VEIGGEGGGGGKGCNPRALRELGKDQKEDSLQPRTHMQV
jgi:hypothetical protein